MRRFSEILRLVSENVRDISKTLRHLRKKLRENFSFLGVFVVLLPALGKSCQSVVLKRWKLSFASRSGATFSRSGTV